MYSKEKELHAKLNTLNTLSKFTFNYTYNELGVSHNPPPTHTIMNKNTQRLFQTKNAFIVIDYEVLARNQEVRDTTIKNYLSA